MNRLNEGKDARSSALRVQRFNESAEHANQNIETAAASSPLRNSDKDWLQDCERALAASR
jgi:gluconate kinase